MSKDTREALEQLKSALLCHLKFQKALHQLFPVLVQRLLVVGKWKRPHPVYPFDYPALQLNETLLDSQRQPD